jgi:hypothetical protein
MPRNRDWLAASFLTRKRDQAERRSEEDIIGTTKPQRCKALRLERCALNRQTR